MSSRRRQLQILAGLLVVFALLLWWRLGDDSTAAVARRALGRGATPAGAGSGAAGKEVVELRVADLEAESARFTPGRDPFRFGLPPARTPPPRRQAPLPPPPPVEVKEVPVQPARPQPPRLDLKYLGSFGPSSRLIAVFTDGREIFNALAGEVLQGRFIVDKIGLESADIKFVGFPSVPAQRLAAGG